MTCGPLFCRCGNNRVFRHTKPLPRSTISIDSVMIPKNASLKIIHAGGRTEVFENALPASHLMEKYKNASLKIIHAGGRTEVFENALPASHLMEKYPDMCVARPEVFKNASASILLPDEKLLLGHKYYIIPFKTAEKLLIRDQSKVKNRGQSESREDASFPRITWDVSEENMEASVFSAKDFYYPKLDKERPTRHFYRRNVQLKRPFGPIFLKPRNGPGGRWEPSLTSVQEISP